MRAIKVTAHGGPEVLHLVDLPTPNPGPGQLLVDTTAIGVNFIDTYFRTGSYPVTLPYVPGQEGCGVVAAIGAEVTDFGTGDVVAWASAPGSYAEQVLVDAAAAVAVPDGIDAPVAASALVQGITAHYLLESVYEPDAGETVLVHAGAGGVGLALTQLAAARGVRVITTVSSDTKEQLSLAAGAWRVLRYGGDLPARVRELTGVGVAAVYDGVGAATFEVSLAALRPRGTLALFGAASGKVPPFDPQRLGPAGSLTLIRPVLAHYIADRAELDWRAGAVFAAIADGSLDVRVGASYPLAEAERAHRDLEARKTTGAVVLIP